jgi:hypothetical protein
MSLMPLKLLNVGLYMKKSSSNYKNSWHSIMRKKVISIYIPTFTLTKLSRSYSRTSKKLLAKMEVMAILKFCTPPLVSYFTNKFPSGWRTKNFLSLNRNLSILTCLENMKYQPKNPKYWWLKYCPLLPKYPLFWTMSTRIEHLILKQRGAFKRGNISQNALTCCEIFKANLKTVFICVMLNIHE